MIVRTANFSDLPGIMEVENNSFIPGIAENIKVFEDRLLTFSAGFFVLVEQKNSQEKIAGYFTSEIWNKIPEQEEASDYFLLGHSAAKLHNVDGNTLYISSIAVSSEYRGKGLGKFLFSECINKIQEKFPQVKQKVLLVNENWKGAKKIYSDYGFEEYCILENFFDSTSGKKSNGILMRCT